MTEGLRGNRIERIRKDYCNYCLLFNTEYEPTTKEMHDCCLCYGSIAKGKPSQTFLDKYSKRNSFGMGL